MSRKRMWTAIVEWNNDPHQREEIDAEGATEREARKNVQAQLDTDYEPGGKIVHLGDFAGMTVWCG